MFELLALTRDELVNIESSTAPNISSVSNPATIGTIVASIVPYIFGIAGFALLLYIVFAGFQILTSRGNEKAVAAAQAQLTYAIVGFIVVFTSYWIVQIVARVLGIQQIQSIFG